MKIRIIREKKVTPIPMSFPLQNPDFFNIQQASTNTTNARDNLLSVFMHHKTYQRIWEHVCIDFHNEVGGALLGYYGSDQGNEFILITDVFNQPPEYFASPTLLRFTSQFYDDLGEYIDQIEAKYPNILRLGLYHTHPNYGVFLSKTDAKTFKGIFKEPFQIAMVVDPVRKEDGVFTWQGRELSRNMGYRVYQTKKPQFALHTTTTRNPLAAKYNTQLQLDTENQIVPKITRYEDEGGITSNPHSPQRITIGAKNQKTGENPQRIQVTKSKHRIKKPEFIPRVCPLFDMHYRSREYRLYRYFRPLRKNTKIREYPFQIFIHRKVTEQWLKALEEKEHVLGLLRGNLHFDRLQNLYFVDAYEIILQYTVKEKNGIRLPAYQALKQLIAASRQKQISNLLAWFYIGKEPSSDIFRFADMHRQSFHRNHHFGIVLRTKTEQEDEDVPPKMVLDVENAYIVAHNFEEQQPFDYFQHLFLYEKPY